MVLGNDQIYMREKSKPFWGHRGRTNFCQFYLPLVLTYPERVSLSYDRFRSYIDIICASPGLK